MIHFKITQQNGEYLVVDKATGIAHAYCGSRSEAQDIVTAQDMDNDREAVESAYNEQHELKAFRAEFIAEFLQG